MTTPHSVYFVDGKGIEGDRFTVISYLHELELEADEFSRIYFHRTGKWTNYETETQLVSVDTAMVDGMRTYFFLGRRGEVTYIDKNGQHQEFIQGPGTKPEHFGYVSQIRNIGGQLYVCGANRQVYCRKQQGWVAIHGNILEKDTSEIRSSFNSIDGTAPNNIYAVGRNGVIFHFDGRDWTEIDSPTNVHLQRVVCTSDDQVYICGYNGIFLRGRQGDWDVYANNDVKENLWGLAIFQGEPYTSHLRGLLRFDGEKLAPVQVDSKENPSCMQLAVSDNYLWSFGNHDIFRFDGSQWQEFICPDNS